MSFPLDRFAFIVLLALLFTGCGTLQVGVEAAHPATSLVIVVTNTPGPTSTRPPVRPTPTGTPAPTPSVPPERISFPVGGTTFAFTARLNEGVTQRYVLQILAQQKMTITTSSHVTIQVFDANNQPLKPTSSQPGQWQGTIPQTADYIIALRGQGLVNVSIDIPPPG